MLSSTAKGIEPYGWNRPRNFFQPKAECYLSQKISEIIGPEAREILIQGITNRSVVSWQHTDLLGECDFSDEKLQDSAGIKPPKLAARKPSDFGSRKKPHLVVYMRVCAKSRGVSRTFVGTSPMTPELRYLVYSTILGLLHLIAASHFISYQYGYRWTASNRDEEKPSLKGIVGRVDRAGINFLETFPFFAALVIAAHLVNRDSSLTLWAARFYFWGRLIYAVAYSAGFPILRSAIWNVATGGIILLIIAVLR